MSKMKNVPYIFACTLFSFCSVRMLLFDPNGQIHWQDKSLVPVPIIFALLESMVKIVAVVVVVVAAVAAAAAVASSFPRRLLVWLLQLAKWIILNTHYIFTILFWIDINSIFIKSLYVYWIIGSLSWSSVRGLWLLSYTYKLQMLKIRIIYM